MATIDPIDNGYGIVSIPTITDIDPSGDVSSPLLVLSDRGGHKFGVIENPVELTFSFELNAPFEISFNIDKFNNDEENTLWDKIETFRLIYVPYWNIWFEIDVQIDEDNNLRKSVTGVRLQEAELGQTMIYGMEVNTENDIDREDYSPTVFYDPDNPEASLLHRLLSKAPHYSIAHVDESLATIQRTFEFDGTSIYDAFNEVAEEISCLFIYGESTEIDGTIARTVSAYDLLSYCPSCGYRGTFEDVCPKCGYEHIVEGYGDDTTIFVTADVLGDSITVSDDKDSVKNCFHLVGGDDLMTATIINCNPNGTQYLWHLPTSTRRHMSTALQRRLAEYDKDYEYYQSTYPFSPSATVVNNYNSLVTKYRPYNADLTPITVPLVGYSAITEQYYNALDFYGFLENTLMPSQTPTDTSAAQQLAKLTVANLSPLGVSNASSASKATVESTLNTYVKVFVDTSRYSVDIVPGSTYGGVTWTGAFKVTSLTDETDTATGSAISITVTDATDTFVKQKIDKMLAKEEIEACDAVQLFDMTLADFKNAIKGHCLSNLELLRSASDSCLEIMISAGIASKNDLQLYNEMYAPYYQKQQAIDAEIKVREQELAKLETALNELIDARYEIMDALNFEDFIKSGDGGEALWVEFCSFRREDEYSNSNYISEGLTNAELIERAVEFIEVANEEIAKASELQYTVSSTLKNLLATHEFDPLPKYFRLGNWIRVGIDDDVYKLRLIGYTLNFDAIDDLNVTFSDVTRGGGFMSDVQDILSRSKSMTTSYSYVQRQAAQGADADRRVKMIASVGLDLTNNKIVSNADNQDVVYDKHGMLFREYDDVLDSYNDKQTKIINRGLYFTTDKWETAKAGIGDFYYYDPETGTAKEGYGVIADTIIGNIILSNEVGVFNETGTVKLTDNGIEIIADGTSPWVENTIGFTIYKKTSSGMTKTFYLDSNGNAHFNGAITATSLTLDSGVTIPYSKITGGPDVTLYIAKDGTIGSDPSSGATGFVVSSAGLLKASNAIIWGTIYASAGTIGGLNLSGNSISSTNGNFSVTSGGVLSATGATISGAITATSLTLGSGVTVPYSKVSGTPDVSIYIAKDGTIGSTPASGATGFVVSSAGLLKASNAIIYGTIYASAGKIGNWSLASNILSSGSGTGYVALDSNTSDTYAIWAGNATAASAPFRVTRAGALYATGATISGNITLGGTNNTNGSLTIKNASNTTIGTWDKDGINVTAGIISFEGTVQSHKTKTELSNGQLIFYDPDSPSTKASVRAYYYNNAYSLIFNIYGGSDSGSGYDFQIDSKSAFYVARSNSGDIYTGRPYTYFRELLQVQKGIQVYAGDIWFGDGDDDARIYGGHGSYITMGGSNVKVSIAGSLSVNGTKSRCVATEDFSSRLLYAYETPSPLFGDVGEGQIGEDGKCYIWLDPIFAETITTNQYQVFLQKYGEGECYISERKAGCFIVTGTPLLSFGWELKAKQADFDQKRLDVLSDWSAFDDTVNYGSNAANYIKELTEGRIVA